jgi:ent-kaurene oxidase
VSSIYVEELGREVSATELCDIMVVDTLLSLAEVDWRDFFPFLSWVPNKGFEEKVIPSEARRSAVTRALINLRRKRLESGKVRWHQLIHINNCTSWYFVSDPVVM